MPPADTAGHLVPLLIMVLFLFPERKHASVCPLIAEQEQLLSVRIYPPPARHVNRVSSGWRDGGND